MIAITSISGKNQITIPRQVIKRLGLDDNMIIEWDITNNNEVILKFRKNNCNPLFERLDEVEEEIAQGNKRKFDVKRITKENQV